MKASPDKELNQIPLSTYNSLYLASPETFIWFTTHVISIPKQVLLNIYQISGLQHLITVNMLLCHTNFGSKQVCTPTYRLSITNKFTSYKIVFKILKS